MHKWQSWRRQPGSQSVHNGTSSTSRRSRAVVSARSGEQQPGFSEAMISLRGITKAYKTDAGPFWALRGIDLQIYRGEFVAVVGKSGSGKSTLINMFTGIDHPTDGEVVVAGSNIRELSGVVGRWVSSFSSFSYCRR
jgi:ABC-type glutathione transport system ATPase component